VADRAQPAVAGDSCAPSRHRRYAKARPGNRIHQLHPDGRTSRQHVLRLSVTTTFRVAARSVPDRRPDTPGLRLSSRPRRVTDNKVTCCGGRAADHRGQRPQARRQRRDIRDAYEHPIRVFELDEGFAMIVGANHAAIIYEIGVVDGVQAPVVVHAMKARDKFLR
jgi:hypothetical protein